MYLAYFPNTLYCILVVTPNYAKAIWKHLPSFIHPFVHFHSFACFIIQHVHTLYDRFKCFCIINHKAFMSLNVMKHCINNSNSYLHLYIVSVLLYLYQCATAYISALETLECPYKFHKYMD